ncbi:MAG: transglycosylase SLT domain-containing protein [Porticoccaceae bacterium]|nr:transglycosylase SLT domain-containing protein [Porticoccaceae bacterium]
MKILALPLLIAALLLTGCSTYRPDNLDNVCAIFRGETDWYEAAVDANKRWGTPIHVMMAIMHQESRFVHDAQPRRKWFLFIPLPRKSSAYGYAQAQNPAWKDYRKATGRSGADRDDFDDAIDFIGWYTHSTQRTLKVSKWDTYNQYLAYHEGRGGYARKSYQGKKWLLGVANKVKRRAATYNSQLKGCKKELDDAIDGWWIF